MRTLRLANPSFFFLFHQVFAILNAISDDRCVCRCGVCCMSCISFCMMTYSWEKERICTSYTIEGYFGSLRITIKFILQLPVWSPEVPNLIYIRQVVPEQRTLKDWTHSVKCLRVEVGGPMKWQHRCLGRAGSDVTGHRVTGFSLALASRKSALQWPPYGEPAVGPIGLSETFVERSERKGGGV